MWTPDLPAGHVCNPRPPSLPPLCMTHKPMDQDSPQPRGGC